MDCHAWALGYSSLALKKGHGSFSNFSDAAPPGEIIFFRKKMRAPLSSALLFSASTWSKLSCFLLVMTKGHWFPQAEDHWFSLADEFAFASYIKMFLFCWPTDRPISEIRWTWEWFPCKGLVFSSTSCFEIFNFDFEMFKAVLSSKPLNTKIPPIS